MFYSYFKIALRSISKNRIYSFINIFGLALGMAASLLILLFVTHEFSFDYFHKNAERIYQAAGKVNYGGQEINMTAMSAAFGSTIMHNDANVENVVGLYNKSQAIIKIENKDPLFEKHFLFTDTSFFSIFSFPILKGNKQLLTQPNKAFITERTNQKYFGNENPIGKTFTYDKKTPFEIVGIVKNPPSNSSIQFDFIASFVTLGTMDDEKSQYNYERVSLGAYDTYFLLKENSAKEKVEETMAKAVGKSLGNDKYLLNKFIDQHISYANQSYLYGFLAISLIILLLALINYMSLTTARATLRAKEVGVRKVIGARRKNLSFQFFLESTLMTTVAFVLSIALVELFMPMFLEKLQLTIDQNFIQTPKFIGIAALLFLVCVFVAGSYPALVLSHFKPIETLKGKLSGHGTGAWMRKGFTTFQFTVSIALIICSMVILKQMDFMKNRKLGLTKEMVMVVNLDKDDANNYRALKNELRNQSGVMKVSSASFTLFDGGMSAFFLKTPTTNEDVFIYTINVDEEFFSTLDIPWKIKPDKNQLFGKLIVNEAGLTKLKMTEKDLGKPMDFFGKEKTEITGIIKDFNFGNSSSTTADGVMISVVQDSSSAIAKYSGAMYIRFSPQVHLAEKVKSIENIFKKYQSSRPFEYYFLDDAFDRLFKSEERMSKIFNAFTFIAIFIACLGLLGLITFTTEVRTKEIGIRKILGASVQNIMVMLTKDYVILIFVSMIIATPLAWWYLQKWLNNFSYKIEIPWWYALVATFIALTIALLITGYQSIKCAIQNPVNSLRSE